MCTSETDGSIFTYIWKIENFDYCSEKRCQPLYSPEFEVGALDNSLWRLVLFPRGDGNEFFVSCFLKRVKSNREEANKVTIYFSLSLLQVDGTLLKSQKVTGHYFKVNGIFGVYDFVKREEIFRNRRQFLFDETLRICCRIWKKNIKLSVEHEQWFARTRMELEQRSFKWVIDNSESTLLKQPSQVFSVDLRLKTISPLIFHLYLLNGNIKLDIRHVNSTVKIFVKCKIVVIVHSSLAPQILEDEYWFNAQTDEQVWQFPTLITKEKLVKMKAEFPWDGVLRLQCECTVSTGAGYNRIERIEQGLSFVHITKQIDTLLDAKGKQLQEVKNPKHGDIQCYNHNSQCNQSFQNKLEFFNSTHSLQDDLQIVYQDKILCDFKLQSSKDVFQVHKTILGARSSVFRAMFESGMKETKTDTVEVEDIDGDTLRRMLLFMYTDKTEQMTWDYASKLYFAADKYEILPLKKICSTVLKDTLCVSNVCEVLVLADMHQDCDLKQAVQNFFLSYDKEILCSDSWNKFEANNVQLAVQTMKYIYLKKLDA